MFGGFDFEVAEEVKRDFYCVICLNLMRNAMELTCGHGMCKSCLEGLKKSSMERKSFICPTCREKVDNNSVTSAAMIDRMILSVKVKCELVSKGCEWIGELSDMKNHLQKRCEFQLVSCTFKYCEKKVERHKLKNHKEKCPYRLEKCQFCDLTFFRSQFQDHLQKKCGFQLVCCTFKPCEEKMEQRKLKSHEEKCPHKLQKCQYCNLTFLRSQIQDHHSKCDRYPVKCPNDCSDEFMERRTLEYHHTICLEAPSSCEFSSFGCYVQMTSEPIFLL
ncbi:TNF receptor-associated factor 4-like isoform X2 [Hydractinia symbiolongicarpus]|uniref:TNF receptor-associated factor 4-like isoform X2 n=1 Tax=Hydractinia symbiolongicarpus TaxID=13093 RepID=UPI00254F39A1|nr:TNF receptor-associated factor 4-like isoform X2 [Hydractinia symbiolongicarpus]